MSDVIDGKVIHLLPTSFSKQTAAPSNDTQRPLLDFGAIKFAVGLIFQFSSFSASNLT